LKVKGERWTNSATQGIRNGGRTRERAYKRSLPVIPTGEVGGFGSLGVVDIIGPASYYRPGGLLIKRGNSTFTIMRGRISDSICDAKKERRCRKRRKSVALIS